MNIQTLFAPMKAKVLAGVAALALITVSLFGGIQGTFTLHRQ